MSTNPGEMLQQLCRIQQRRIWRRRVLGHMYPLTGWIASVLLVAGASQQLIGPLSPLLMIGIALLPPLFILLWRGFVERPTMDEAAAVTDRQLDAQSQFVSSWEIARSSAAPAGVDRLLMSRSEAALPGWNQRIKNQPSRPLHPAILIAILLSVSGLFLLLQPPQTQQIGLEESTSQTDSTRQPDDPALRLGQLFNIDHKSLTAPPQQPYPSSSRAAATAFKKEHPATIKTNNYALPKYDGKNSPIDDLSIPPAAGTIPASQPEGRSMGNTAGNQPSSATIGPTIPSKAFDSINRINIEIDNHGLSTAFDRNRVGRALLVTQPEAPVYPQALTRYTGVTSMADSSTGLTAQQRSMVRRYLKQLEVTDENGE